MSVERAERAKTYRALHSAMMQDVIDGRLEGELGSVTTESFQTSFGAESGYNTALKVWGLGDPVAYLCNTATGMITKHNDGEVLTPSEGAELSVPGKRKGKRNPSRADRFGEAIGQIESGKTALEELKDELESWRDNMPENLQQSQTYEMLEAAIDELDNAISQADEVCGVDVEFPGMFQG